MQLRVTLAVWSLEPAQGTAPLDAEIATPPHCLSCRDYSVVSERHALHNLNIRSSFMFSSSRSLLRTTVTGPLCLAIEAQGHRPCQVT